MGKHFAFLVLFSLFSTSVFALVCTTPEKISANATNPFIWETAAKIDGRFVIWQDVDTNHYPRFFNLEALDLGPDMLFGTSDDIGPTIIAQDVDQFQYAISGNVVGFIKDSNVYYCTFAPGGCVPDNRGAHHFSMITGFEDQEKSNIAIDGNIFVWSQSSESGSPVDLLVVHNIDNNSTVAFLPLDSNQAIFIPFVKNSQVFWQEIDKSQGVFLKIHLIHYNASTGHKSILESVNYPTPFHKIKSISSYTPSNTVISVVMPNNSVKFFVYDSLTDQLVERITVPVSNTIVLLDNKTPFSVYSRRYVDENGFFDTIAGIKRNLTHVDLYSGPRYGILSELTSSNSNIVFTEYKYDSTINYEESKIKFMSCQ